MAWGNTLRASPGEKLNRIKGWEERGLAYWQTRMRICQGALFRAEDSASRSRWMEQMHIAEQAVIRLEPRR